MSAVAIVPCRSGSRGLKNKNILPIMGKPLMAYSLEPALQAKNVDRVILDTDSEEYAKIGRQYGADTPYLRPADLAEDVPTEKVLIHALKWLETHESYKPGIVVCLQATTPFIKAGEIDRLVSSVKPFGDFDSATTICESVEHPEWMFTRRENGLLQNINPRRMLNGNWGVRQKLAKRYRLNGAGYASTRSLILDEERIIGRKCFGLIMPRSRSTDIDTQWDFDVAEYALSKQGKTQVLLT